MRSIVRFVDFWWCGLHGRLDIRLLDDADAARKRYKKDLDLIKPDLASYNKQKELALGLAPGTLVKAGGSSSGITHFDPKQGSSLQVCTTPL